SRCQSHDAGLIRVLRRYVLHAEYAASVRLEYIHHLLEAWHRGIDQIVREMHHEGRIADDGPGAQHGVAEAQRRRLPDVHARSPARQNPAQRIEQFLLALRLQHGLELGIAVEMILDGALGTAGDEHQCVGAGGERLVDRILNERLVDDREHFLRAGPGDGEESRAASGDGEYDCLYGFVGHEEMITDFTGARRRTNLTQTC